MKRSALAALAALALLGCAPATLTEVEREVFTPSCVFSSCHQGAFAQAGLALDGRTYARLVNVGAVEAAGRALVVPKDLAQSYLYEKLTREAPQSGVRMPQGATLDAQQLELVRSWIQAGAQDD